MFVCPYCHQDETENHSKDTPHEGRYCSKECYQQSWSSHKLTHKPATTAKNMSAGQSEDLALKEMIVMASDMMTSSPIGRQRSRSTSAISCRYDEGEEELETDDLDVNPIPPLPIPDNNLTTLVVDVDSTLVDSTLIENLSAGKVSGNVSVGNVSAGNVPVPERSSNIIGASYHNLIPPPPPYLPNYYPWQTTYPQLQLLIGHIEEIKAEVLFHTTPPLICVTLFLTNF